MELQAALTAHAHTHTHARAFISAFTPGLTPALLLTLMHAPALAATPVASQTLTELPSRPVTLTCWTLRQYG